MKSKNKKKNRKSMGWLEKKYVNFLKETERLFTADLLVY